MSIGIGVRSISENTQSELNPGNPIDLEFGLHRSEIISPTQSSWYRDSMWSEAVQNRLRGCGAHVMGIDSFVHGEDINTPNHTLNYKVALWQALPLNPSNINKDGVVYLPTVDFNNVNQDYLLLPDEQQVLLAKYFYHGVRSSYKLSEGTAEIMATRAFLGGLLAASAVTGAYSYNQAKRLEKAAKANSAAASGPRNFSRREFLKLGAVAIGASAVSSLPYAINTVHHGAMVAVDSTSVDRNLEQVLIKIVDALDHTAFYKDSIVEGRTAAMIERTKETMEYLGRDSNEQGIVLAGNAHMINAHTLQNSRDARFEAMNKMFVDLMKIRDVCGMMTGINPNLYFQSLMDKFLEVKIYTATDPRRQPDFPNWVVLDDCLTVTDSFVSKFTQQAQMDAGI